MKLNLAFFCLSGEGHPGRQATNSTTSTFSNRKDFVIYTLAVENCKRLMLSLPDS